MMRSFLKSRNQLGECPIWCSRSQRLFWTDIVGKVLHAHDSATGEVQSWPMPARVGSFAFTGDANVLLLGLEDRLALYNITDHRLSVVSASPGQPGTRINDGRCDRDGNFVFGTMHEGDKPERVGAFYRLSAATMTVEQLDLPGVAIANGICFSPDGKKMYYCDSLQQKIFCCDYPSLNNQKTFAAVTGTGSPDGSCVDAHGFLWNAEWGGSRVVRYSPNGEIDRILHAPAQLTTCPVIGGEHYDTLYCTTATMGLASQSEFDGDMLYKSLADVTGLPENHFAGGFSIGQGAYRAKHLSSAFCRY